MTIHVVRLNDSIMGLYTDGAVAAAEMGRLLDVPSHAGQRIYITEFQLDQTKYQPRTRVI